MELVLQFRSAGPEFMLAGQGSSSDRAPRTVLRPRRVGQHKTNAPLSLSAERGKRANSRLPEDQVASQLENAQILGTREA